MISASTFLALGQCDIKINQRDDGVNVKYLTPIIVGYDDDVLMMIGLQSNGVDYFVNTAAAYKGASVKASAFLTLRFANNTSIKLKYINSGIVKINGYNGCSGLFAISKNQLPNLISSTLVQIIYHEITGLNRVIKIQKNNSVLSDQYQCLRH
jgi:hypothetical protein